MNDLVPLDLLSSWSWYIGCMFEIRSIIATLFSDMYLSFFQRVFERCGRRFLI